MIDLLAVPAHDADACPRVLYRVTRADVVAWKIHRVFSITAEEIFPFRGAR